MGGDGAKLLIITVLLALLCGGGVLIFNDKYTVENNMMSNENYCSTIKPEWNPETDGENTDRDAEETSRGQRDRRNTR